MKRIGKRPVSLNDSFSTYICACDCMWGCIACSCSCGGVAAVTLFDSNQAQYGRGYASWNAGYSGYMALR